MHQLTRIIMLSLAFKYANQITNDKKSSTISMWFALCICISKQQKQKLDLLAKALAVQSAIYLSRNDIIPRKICFQ